MTLPPYESISHPYEKVQAKKYNIICLQDTHINKTLESFIKAKWGYKAYFSSFTTNCPGLMILMDNNFYMNVKGVKMIIMRIILSWRLLQKIHR